MKKNPIRTPLNSSRDKNRKQNTITGQKETPKTKNNKPGK